MKLELRVDTAGTGAAIAARARRTWIMARAIVIASIIPLLIFLSLSAVGSCLRVMGNGHEGGIGAYR